MPVVHISDDLSDKLLSAIYRNDVRSISDLLELVDVNSKPFLHIAIGLNHHFKNDDVILALISHGANSNLGDLEFGNDTPLHCAARSGNKKIIQILIVANADVNKTNDKGSTPLHEAVYYGNKEAVLALLKAGAKTNVMNNDGYVPLLYAVMHDDMDLARVLIEHSADVGISLPFGKTLLHYAAIRKNFHIMKILIDAGADLHKKDDNGNTPLDLTSDEIRAKLESDFAIDSISCDILQNDKTLNNITIRKNRSI